MDTKFELTQSELETLVRHLRTASIFYYANAHGDAANLVPQSPTTEFFQASDCLYQSCQELITKLDPSHYSLPQ